MVFVSRGRGRSGRGRRGVGEVSFESRNPLVGADHRSHQGHYDRLEDDRDSHDRGESHQLTAKTLRITVGNDQYRERRDDRQDRALSHPLGQPGDSYSREARVFESEKERGYDNRNPYRSRDSREYVSEIPDQREYREGQGFTLKNVYPTLSVPDSEASLFPAASRSSATAETAALATRLQGIPPFPPAPQVAAGPNSSGRPLKSILKKKSEPSQEKLPEKPSGLPGISNYMDDIDDEEKFLYGEDNEKRKNQSYKNSSDSDSRSGVKSWQPSHPESSVSNYMSTQAEYSNNSQVLPQPGSSSADMPHTQPSSAAPQQGGDLWSMLAKTVQTVQQQQVPVTCGASQQQVYQTPVSHLPQTQTPLPQQGQPVPPGGSSQSQQGAGYDPTIENILKSIGFDFDMSKRMQEKAKQQAGEPPPKSVPQEESQYGVGQMSSFIGSEMSHSDMRSKLGKANKTSILPGAIDRPDGWERDRSREQRSLKERVVENRRSSTDMFHESPTENVLEKLQRGCSPVSAEGSPPPMFNLPPIKIKRKKPLERNRSPGWERSFRSRSRSPTRVSDSGRDKRSRSPSWSRSISSSGRRQSRSPGRRRSRTPPRYRSPSPRVGRSPIGRARSPIIRRTINISPKFKRRTPSPRHRSRSPVVSRRFSDVRRDLHSPVSQRRSFSDRRHSNSPEYRRRSIGRERSPSPRGRKRFHSTRSSRSRSRERKFRRSTSRGRQGRSRSRSRGHRTGSSDSDSDVDAPANKQYFSSPLRLNNNPRFDRPYPGPPVPQMPPQMPPADFGPMPPFSQFQPTQFQPPPAMPLYGMPPSGPPPFSMLPGPPPINYNFPPPPSVSVTPAPDIVPPGTVDIQMPLNIPSRTCQPIVNPIVEEGDKKRFDVPSSNKKDKKEGDSRASSSQQAPGSLKSRSVEAGDISTAVMPTRTIKVSSKSKTNEIKDRVKLKARLLKDKDSMALKIKALQKELETLKDQQNELKKTTKDGKSNIILEENLKLSDEIRKELGKVQQALKDFLKKNEGILERDQKTLRGTPKKEAIKRGKQDSIEVKIEKGKMMRHQFVDEGKHWCKGCKSTFSNIHDYVQHLASYKHKQTLPVGFKPWRELFQPNDGMIVNKNGIRVPLPGIEFLHPVNAYFCELCKVFLGDVSNGADHFRCESHYLNYKKYCKENPFYEKKQREDKEAVTTEKEKKSEHEMEIVDKAIAMQVNEQVEDKTKEIKLTRSQVREQEKQKKQETENRIQEKEKKWEKDVDELEDINIKVLSQETTKGQIKLTLKQTELKDVKKIEEKVYREEELNEAADKADNKYDENDKNEKSKIAININLVGKNLVGKGAGLKKNPLLPPWQPVGKKIETRVTKYSSATPTLDDFLTSKTGKVPIVSEQTQKKKVTPEEVLKAFALKEKIAQQEKAKAEAERIEAEKKEAERLEADRIKAEQEAARTEAEEDMKIMGIDPESEEPLAVKKPPPPVSQNVPHPSDKPSSTISESNVHNVFFSDKNDTDLAEIPTEKVDTTSISNKRKDSVKCDHGMTVSCDSLSAAISNLDSIPLPDPIPENGKNNDCKWNKESPILNSNKILAKNESISLDIPLPEEKLKDEMKMASVKSGTEITSNKVTEPMPHKTTESTPDRVTVSISENVKQPMQDEVTEPTPDKVTEPTPDKITEPKSDKVIEPLPYNVTETTPDKVTEPMPDRDKETSSETKVESISDKETTPNSKNEKEYEEMQEDEEQEPTPKKGQKATRGKGRRGRGRGRKTAVTVRRSTRSAIAAVVKEIDDMTEKTEQVKDQYVQNDSTEGKAVENTSESSTSATSVSASGSNNNSQDESLLINEISVSDPVRKRVTKKNVENTKSSRKSASRLARSCKSQSRQQEERSEKDKEPEGEAFCRKCFVNGEASDASVHMGSDFEVVDDLEDMEVVDEIL